LNGGFCRHECRDWAPQVSGRPRPFDKNVSIVSGRDRAGMTDALQQLKHCSGAAEIDRKSGFAIFPA
jgi:hypothetical protein